MIALHARARWPALIKAWRRFEAWFDARARRERWVLILGALCLIWWAADAVWIEQAQRQWHQHHVAAQAWQAQLHQASAELEGLRTQRAVRARDGAVQLQVAQDQLRASEQRLRTEASGLVDPLRMRDLLQALLLGPGCAGPAKASACEPTLRVKSLRNLPATALSATAAASAVAPSASSADAGQVVLWRHGMDIVLEGRYADVQAYVARVEKLPQRLLRGGMSFSVEQYPTVTLTLHLYTLSLDAGWLEI
jgi:MSHA biogenesis protein MshJ